jgi:hypothetical protein
VYSILLSSWDPMLVVYFSKIRERTLLVVNKPITSYL